MTCEVNSSVDTYTKIAHQFCSSVTILQVYQDVFDFIKKKLIIISFLFAVLCNEMALTVVQTQSFLWLKSPKIYSDLKNSKIEEAGQLVRFYAFSKSNPLQGGFI